MDTERQAAYQAEGKRMQARYAPIGTPPAQQFTGTEPNVLSTGLPNYGAAMTGPAPVTVEQEIGRLAEEVAQQARALTDARQDTMRSSMQLSDAEKRFADVAARLSAAMEQHRANGQMTGLR